MILEIYSLPTIWQIALMNEEGDNTCVMFKKHFIRLLGMEAGENEMVRQCLEVFPDGAILLFPLIFF